MLRGLFLTLSLFVSVAAWAQSFRDVAREVGLEPMLEKFVIGASVVDINNDGLVDLYHFGRLYIQQYDGTFVDKRAELGLLDEGQVVFGAIFGDYNNDGLLDAFFEDLNKPGFLYRSELDGSFTLSNDAANLQANSLVQGSAWGDFNSDGKLDLFIGSDDGLNQLYLNESYDLFRNVSSSAGIFKASHSYGVAASDFDQDGDLDLFIAACGATPVESLKVLFQNNGNNTFTDVAAQSGVADDLASWGTVWFDYDNDGWQDLYVANMPSNSDGRSGINKLYRNNGQGRFFERGVAAGVAGDSLTPSLNVSAADLDNNGWLDLILSDNQRAPNTLYMNQGDGTFTQQELAISGIDGGNAVAAADINGDGWVDLYLPDTDREVLLINEGGAFHWLNVHVRGKNSNHFGVGTRIEAYAGDLHQVREVTAGSGMTSQNHNLAAHFGLNTHTQIDSLVVHWPSGHVDRVVALEVDQSVTLVEGLGLNQPPNPFRLASPADSSVLMASESRFEWEVAEDTDDDVLYSAILTGAGQQFAFEDLSEPFVNVDLSQLPDGHRYHWTVLATDGHTKRRSIDRWTFDKGLVTSTREPVPVFNYEISNSPNPFRTKTEIRFSLPATEQAEINVYDLRGRLVRHLLDETLLQGQHVRTWDGLDQSGVLVPAGAYFVLIRTANHIQSHTLIRVR